MGHTSTMKATDYRKLAAETNVKIQDLQRLSEYFFKEGGRFGRTRKSRSTRDEGAVQTEDWDRELEKCGEEPASTHDAQM